VLCAWDWAAAYVLLVLTKLFEVNVTFTFQMKQLKYREVKWLFQSHTATWQSHCHTYVVQLQSPCSQPLYKAAPITTVLLSHKYWLENQNGGFVLWNENWNLEADRLYHQTVNSRTIGKSFNLSTLGDLIWLGNKEIQEFVTSQVGSKIDSFKSQMSWTYSL
jgi:hypothetical protein